MKTVGDIVTARDLALQKIGRNVVNFQRMEAMLKFVLTFASFSAPASKTATHLAQRASGLRTRPMGALVEKTAKVLHSESECAPPDIEEVWVSQSFKFAEGQSNVTDWRREMRKVVRERNQLIHHTLASFDPNTLESCNKLCTELDHQRERILPAYKHLESMVLAIRETHQELANSIDEIVADIMAARARHSA